MTMGRTGSGGVGTFTTRSFPSMDHVNSTTSPAKSAGNVVVSRNESAPVATRVPLKTGHLIVAEVSWLVDQVPSAPNVIVKTPMFSPRSPALVRPPDRRSASVIVVVHAPTIASGTAAAALGAAALGAGVTLVPAPPEQPTVIAARTVAMMSRRWFMLVPPRWG